MDVPPLLFDNGSFDTVLCCEMIEHIDEGSGKELLKEIYRVLNKKGTFFLTTPNASNKEPEKNHLKEYTESEMISLLGGIGFEILSVEGFSISFNKYCPRWLKKLPNLRKMVGKFIDLTLRSFLIQYGKKSPSKAEHMAILCKK